MFDLDYERSNLPLREIVAVMAPTEEGAKRGSAIPYVRKFESLFLEFPYSACVSDSHEARERWLKRIKLGMLEVHCRKHKTIDFKEAIQRCSF